VAASRLIIAGGGLAGGLAALAIAKARPDIDLLLVEEAARFGGNHIWSFFADDVAADGAALIDDLVVHRWPRHEVIFPERRRTLDTGYASLTSERFDAVLRATLPAAAYRLGRRIADISPQGIVLDDGETIAADGVIDARGAAGPTGLDLGWQKFVGREYRFARPHGLEAPIIMDATVDQSDGYRFVYCLPFSTTEMLVEDTYYSQDGDLDDARTGRRIEAYIDRQGWQGGRMIREERGVLPVAMGGDIDLLWRDATVARIGLRGGFFHPTTGYSLPDAVRNALLLARQTDLSSAALLGLFRGAARRAWQARGFYRILNRMLFRAAEPAERYRVLQHFYRLDPGLVGRFYAGRSTLADKARILSGRPPVPLLRAAASLFASPARPAQ
jgi:lycopene beta-cyclase